MTEGLAQFRQSMNAVVQMSHQARLSNKVQRYVNAFCAGLPQDITVRWFPLDDMDAIRARVKWLAARGLETWISQGLPGNPDVQSRVTSVERKTDLIKAIHSLEDFAQRAVPRFAQWDGGSWAKVFFDTPQRALVGGTLRIDTNTTPDADMRALRLEVASGISDVRDLDRQMSARKVLVISSRPTVIEGATRALEADNYEVSVVDSSENVLAAALEQIGRLAPRDDPETPPGEPKVIVLDWDAPAVTGTDLLDALKNNALTSSIPLVLIAGQPSELPAGVRRMIASAVQFPLISADHLRASVRLTGFRLFGGPLGFDWPPAGHVFLTSVANLLGTIFGPDRSYLRMMVQIANQEQRPTIAFEFKLVPIAPYDFFFLDYEWSGRYHPFHRFDWLYDLGDGN